LTFSDRQAEWFLLDTIPPPSYGQAVSENNKTITIIFKRTRGSGVTGQTRLQLLHSLLLGAEQRITTPAGTNTGNQFVTRQKFHSLRGG